MVFAENVNTNSPILAAVVPMDGSVSQIFHFVFLKDEENKVEAYLAKVGLNLYPLKTEGNRCECVVEGSQFHIGSIVIATDFSLYLQKRG